MNRKATISLFLLLSLGWVSCKDNETNAQAAGTGQPNDSIKTKSLIVVPDPQIDQSPMDMCYYPADYPKLKMTGETNAMPDMRLIYSRPQKKGRKIFGGLLKYGEPWRLGANEATEIEFFKPVKIQTRPIAPGKYILYCIPEEKQWEIVLNSNLYSWGLHFDSTKDVQKFMIPVEPTRAPVEYFTMVFENRNDRVNLVMAWDSIKASLPIEIK